MKGELKRFVEDVANNPIIEKTVPPATITSGALLAYELIPFVLGSIAAVVGIMASLAIRRERNLKSKLHEINLHMAEELKSEMEERKKKGLPLRRITDEQEDD